jgi:hypothetical protein
MPGMARALRPKAFLLAAIVFSAIIPTAAQVIQPNNSSAEKTTVTGTVINSETKEPIRGALVEMAGFAKLTDDKGAFSFQDVPRMSASIGAQKPGYFDERQVSRPYRQPKMIDVAPGMQPLTVDLIPEGIVFGQINSSDGETPEGVTVTLVAFGIQEGRRAETQRFNTRTDDQGRFRIANLIPGTYYLSAGPSSTVEVIPASAPRTPPTVMGYSFIYYPSSPDLANATPIEITPGKHFEAQLSIPRVPFFPISGTVSGVNPGQNLILQFEGSSGNFAGGGFTWNIRTGIFRSNPMPAGTYTVRATARDNRPMATPGDALPSFTARVEVNLNSNTPGLHLALAPAKTIPINIVIDPTSQQDIPQYSPVIPAIFPVNPDPGRTMNRGFSMIGGPGKQKFTLPDLDPGRYQVEFRPNGNFYAASATFGNVDLLRDDLVIGSDSNAEAIDVLVRDDGGSLKATIAAMGDKSQFTVFAVSEQYPRSIALSFTGQDGMANFWGLAPGGYKVFALDNADNLEYRKPGALDIFLLRASQITVAPKHEAAVSVALIHREN